jgi:hypothetical protein
VAALVVGLFLIPVAIRWMAEIEWVRYSDNSTTQALFPHSVTILVCLALGSALLRRITPKLAFGGREILICYICVCVGSNLAGHDMLQVLYSSIGYVIQYARPENAFAELIHPYLPWWTVPQQGPGLRAFFEGQSNLFAPGNWVSWRAPALSWGAFTLVASLVMLAGNNLLRKQWENERLTFPIAQVPLWLTRDDGANMLGRTFLLGVGLGVLPAIFNTIKHFYPIFPGMRVQVHYAPALEGVWAAAGILPVAWHPFAFGLAYLVPTDLLFSCWFFYVFTCVVRVIAYAMGFRYAVGFPYVDQQATGAHLGLAMLVLYNARRHLGHIGREVFRPRDATPEDVRYWRLWLAVLVAGSALIHVWLRLIGFSLVGALAWPTLFYAIVLAVSRLRAEYGLPTNELFQKGPEYIMVSAAGSRAFGRRDLVGMALMNWITRTHRQFPMQVQADMIEIGRRGGVPPRWLNTVLTMATVVGIVAAKWAILDVSMREGVASARVKGPALWAFGPEPWAKVCSWINGPTLPDYGQAGGFVYGAFFCALLYRLRIAWVWWPFHPGGYVMSCTFGLARLWVPLFLTWCFKSCILRYGGHRFYLLIRPFFLGLIVGEYGSAIARTLIDIGWGLYLPAESGIGGL